MKGSRDEMKVARNERESHFETWETGINSNWNVVGVKLSRANTFCDCSIAYSIGLLDCNHKLQSLILIFKKRVAKLAKKHFSIWYTVQQCNRTLHQLFLTITLSLCVVLKTTHQGRLMALEGVRHFCSKCTWETRWNSCWLDGMKENNILPDEGTFICHPGN